MPEAEKTKALLALIRKKISTGGGAEANAGNAEESSLDSIVANSVSACRDYKQLQQRHVNVSRVLNQMRRNITRTEKRLKELEKEIDDIRQKGGTKGGIKYKGKKYGSEEKLEEEQRKLLKTIEIGERTEDFLSKRKTELAKALAASAEQRRALNAGNSFLLPLLAEIEDRTESEEFAAAEAEVKLQEVSEEGAGEKG